MKNIDRLTEKGTRYMTGQCIKCIDGDTIDFLCNGEVFRVRLYGIDTPERGQKFAKDATKFMEKLIGAGDYISVETKSRGFHKRWIGEVAVHNVNNSKRIININKSMVKAGYAWVNEETMEERKDYRDNFIYAKSREENIHSDKSLINPAEYRRSKGKNKKKLRR